MAGLAVNLRSRSGPSVVARKTERYDAHHVRPSQDDKSGRSMGVVEVPVGRRSKRSQEHLADSLYDRAYPRMDFPPIGPESPR
jgi:hypothetical protein